MANLWYDNQLKHLDGFVVTRHFSCFLSSEVFQHEPILFDPKFKDDDIQNFEVNCVTDSFWGLEMRGKRDHSSLIFWNTKIERQNKLERVILKAPNHP